MYSIDSDRFVYNGSLYLEVCRRVKLSFGIACASVVLPMSVTEYNGFLSVKFSVCKKNIGTTIP